MAKLRPLGNTFGVQKSFGTEDGVHYRHYSQDIDPIIKHVKERAEYVNSAPKAANRNGWQYGGAIPMSMLVDFFHRTGHTMEEFATNQGGESKVTIHNYHRDPGVKAMFFREFFSRDNAKLHTQHATTKTKSAMSVVPKSILSQAVKLDGI